MPIRINVNVGGKRFSLHCYEDQQYEGDHWFITEAQQPNIPGDEITSFQLEGDVGVKVEFFDDQNGSKSQSWGEATLVNENQRINIGHINRSAGSYIFHKAGGGKLAGKVDRIDITSV
jgi:hypothetical protein